MNESRNTPIHGAVLWIALAMTSLMGIMGMERSGAASGTETAPEVYPALDPNAKPGYVEVPRPISISDAQVETTSNEILSEPAKPKLPAPSAKAKVEKAQTKPTQTEAPDPLDQEPQKASDFAKVPNEHIYSLSRRIRLVDLILRRHGRAYDYRVLTNSQLEEILRDLEAEAQRARQTN